jgi:hypothetical protein
LDGIDDEEVLNTFLQLLQRGEDSPESWAQSGVEMWRQSGMVRVSRADPVATPSGKILPFHLRKTRTETAPRRNA